MGRPAGGHPAGLHAAEHGQVALHGALHVSSVTAGGPLRRPAAPTRLHPAQVQNQHSEFLKTDFKNLFNADSLFLQRQEKYKMTKTK